jgi:hypothetical protein
LEGIRKKGSSGKSPIKKKPQAKKSNARKKPVSKKGSSSKTRVKKTSGPVKKTVLKAASKKGAGKKTSPPRTTAGKPKTTVKKKTASPSKGRTTAKKKADGVKKRKGAAIKKTVPKTTVKKSTAGKSAAGKAPSVKTSSVKTKVKRKTASVKKATHKPPVKPPFAAYKGIRPYLFSSYAHRNMKIVFKILKKLSKDRYRIWYDEGIEPGFEWPEVVGNAVINCTQFLVFMSPVAADSRNVRNEVNLAFNENKDIIVVFLGKTSLSSGMKLQIGTVQYINHYELTEREFYGKLTNVLNSSQRS